MLFSHHNGVSQPVTDDSISQLQELACGIGPQIDGVITSVMQPQSMGAYATQGAAGACMLRNQQSEQHQPTTMSQRGFGDSMGSTLLPLTTSQLILQKAIAVRTASAAPAPSGTATAPTSATAIPLPLLPLDTLPASPTSPAMPLPTTTTYPAGTITAFDASTNMWRVAVPTVAAGLGMFGAAAAYTEIAPVAAPPVGATQVSKLQLLKQTGQLPLYKKWQFWAAAVGGLAVVGTGTALLFRRKRAA